MGLTVQALAALVFAPVAKRYGRAEKKKDAFKKLTQQDKDLLKDKLGAELSPEQLFTRCVTRFEEKLDSYIKFKALADVCRSISFVFLFVVVISLALLTLPTYRQYILQGQLHSVSRIEVILTYVAFHLFFIASSFSLIYRSLHFTRISNEIVFDVAISELRETAYTVQTVK